MDTTPIEGDDLTAARAREAALREVLEVISRSRDDDGPVFRSILSKAAGLCDAPMARLHLVDEDRKSFRVAAFWGDAPRAMTEGENWPLDPEFTLSRTLIDGETLHMEDHAKSGNYLRGDPVAVRIVEEEGIRTRLSVPLLRGTTPIGSITLSRRVVKPFTPDQIALVETFAAQAVIAIENVRQFRELQTRLEREKASREILGVISRSRDQEQPVFEVILENAARLCDAPYAGLTLVNAQRTHARIVTQRGGRPEFLASFDMEFPLDSPLLVARTINEARPIQIDDLADDDLYRQGDPIRRKIVDVEGARTQMAVPLIGDGDAIGCIVLYRRKVRPFSPEQIALLDNFAAQAVIAIENVRQFRELQVRLEREKASAEILEVISQSRDNEQPVFDVILENAARLCGSPQARLHIVNGAGSHFRLAAAWGESLSTFDVGEEFPIDRPQIIPTAIRETRTIHIEDIANDQLYAQGDPIRRRLVDVEGIRTYLTVPLVSGDRAFGSITLSRREVRPFAEAEIALVETFAAQAVIAIENVRQFRELQTRLEREKASRETLQVISRSRDDDMPVFDTILENACRLCNAPLAYLSMVTEDGAHVVSPARRGAFESFGVTLDKLRVPLAGSRLALARSIAECRVIRMDDIADDDVYRSGDPNRVSMVEDEGARSLLVVPLVSDGAGIGSITLYRREVAPFSDDDVTLVEGFAAQAVIAIENVRQFRELQTRLEREAASREILGVISRSRDDATPVFDTLLACAKRLCGASNGAIVLGEEGGGPQVLAAQTGASEETLEQYRTGGFLMDPGQSLAAQAILERRTLYFEDVKNGAPYREGMAVTRRLVEKEEIRTSIYVPLISGGEGIGCLNLHHREQHSYSEDQIALLETFAAQAVIAIENVRQFRELQERLERERATGEVLSIISRSRDVEQPVFDAILESSARLCDSPSASLFLLDKEREALVYRSQWGEPFTAFEVGVSTFPMSLDIKPVQAVRDGRTYHVADIAEVDTYLNSDPVAVKSVDDEGIRTLLSVPLMLGPDGIGCINLVRREVKPFDDRQIELVRTFAAQAVIAIENVRQFKALEARTEEVQALNSSLEERVEAQVGEIERMGKLKSFLPAAVADAVVSSGSEKMLKSHRALLGILFCDMRGFTAFCETAEPEETIEVLQTYHQEMGKLIAAHGAGVDHRMGDGIMVLFNDPLPCEDPAGEAVRLAMAMREKMVELCAGWKKLGHRLGFGVGVSLGYATVGMVGYEERSEYTASGTAVNLAARLCDHAEDGEILLSPRAAIAVEDDVVCEPGGVLELKGLTAPVEVMKAVAPR